MGPDSDPLKVADTVWSADVRLIGAGIIGVGGLWTVVTLIPSIVKIFVPRGRGIAPAPGDIPMTYVAIAVFSLLLLTGLFLARFSPSLPVWAVLLTTLVLAVFGFLMSTACGYMAGLLGSSSSPISGIGLLTILVTMLYAKAALPAQSVASTSLVSVALFVTTLIVTMSSIANDNLQDLKTGQMVGATAWKQQVALAIGVAAGAAVIGPVLAMLDHAYGFVGVATSGHAEPRNALPAPQAALVAQIATGIANDTLPWSMLAVGGGLGVMFIGVETLFRRRGASVPAMTIGIGMYLPCPVVVTIALGGVLGWLTARGAPDDSKERRRRRGLLVASGLIIGESLVGIVVAGADTMSGATDALRVLSQDPGRLSHALTVLIWILILFAVFKWITADTGAPGRDSRFDA